MPKKMQYVVLGALSSISKNRTFFPGEIIELSKDDAKALLEANLITEVKDDPNDRGTELGKLSDKTE